MATSANSNNTINNITNQVGALPSHSNSAKSNSNTGTNVPLSSNAVGPQQQQQQQATSGSGNNTGGVNPNTNSSVNVVGVGGVGNSNFGTIPANSLSFNLPLNMNSFPFQAQQFMQQHAAAQAAQAQAASQQQQHQQHQQQQQQQQQQTPSKGGIKKQKGLGGVAMPVPPPTISPVQLAQFQQMSAAGLPGFTGVNAPYSLLGYAAIGGGNNPGGAAVMESTPRGRWSEEMTQRLIELRTKMDAKFRTIARPDKLWADITQNICQEFGAVLSRQSTKDKCSNQTTATTTMMIKITQALSRFWINNNTTNR